MLFYEIGPNRGHQELAIFLTRQMDRGLLRQADPQNAALHLMALLNADTLMPWLFGRLEDPSKDYLRTTTEHALQAFFAGYAVR